MGENSNASLGPITLDLLPEFSCFFALFVPFCGYSFFAILALFRGYPNLLVCYFRVPTEAPGLNHGVVSTEWVGTLEPFTRSET